MYWDHQISWNQSKYFFLSLFLFLSVCFHAVKGIWYLPRYYFNDLNFAQGLDEIVWFGGHPVLNSSRAHSKNEGT